jgi:hypothetical protein
MESMRVGLVGPSYQMFSLPFDAQRTINLFPVLDEMGKEVSSLYMTPGLLEFADTGAGANRGCFTADNGRCFFVAGSTLYEIDSAGVTTSRGSLNQSSGNVTFAENGLQLAICDGSTLYILTYSTNAYSEVTDSDFPGAASVTFLDGYFIVNEPNTARFYISALFDGLSWGALDFATAEGSPDNLVRVFAALGQLWLMGERTIEIWNNTGGSAVSTFPFQRVNGARIDIGILAGNTTVNADNSLFWLGGDEYGRGFVYRTNGFSPVRISTEAIELKLQEVANLAEVTAYAYQQQGHLFYVLTGGGLETTFVYDVSTQQWHERAFLNDDGLLEQHLGISCTFAFNKHLIGDRRNGKIYEMSMDYYSDNGEEIVRDRIYTHISNEDTRIRFNALDIGVETGVGTQSGDDANPQISLRLSKDGARTWSNSYTKSIGAVGKYQTKVTFRRLGVADQMTFRIRISSRVKVAITGSYLT